MVRHADTTTRRLGGPDRRDGRAHHLGRDRAEPRDDVFEVDDIGALPHHDFGLFRAGDAGQHERHHTPPSGAARPQHRTAASAIKTALLRIATFWTSLIRL